MSLSVTSQFLAHNLGLGLRGESDSRLAFPDLCLCLEKVGQTPELFGQLAFPLDSLMEGLEQRPGACHALGCYLAPWVDPQPTTPTPTLTPVLLRDSDELAGQREKFCADIWHHRGLFLAQAGDTNVIKSVFKLDNILDILAEMPEHEKLLPSHCVSPNSNSGAV